MTIKGDYILINNDIRYTEVYENKYANRVFFDLALRCNPNTHTYKFRMTSYCSDLNIPEREMKKAMEILRDNRFVEFYKDLRGTIIAFILPNEDLYIISNNHPPAPMLKLLNIHHNRSSEKGYSKFRENVLKRDHFKCCMCGSEENLEVHHIKPFAKYPKLRTTISNGVTLCNSCHKSLHKGEKRSGNL